MKLYQKNTQDLSIDNSNPDTVSIMQGRHLVVLERGKVEAFIRKVRQANKTKERSKLFIEEK